MGRLGTAVLSGRERFCLAGRLATLLRSASPNEKRRHLVGGGASPDLPNRTGQFGSGDSGGAATARPEREAHAAEAGDHEGPGDGLRNPNEAEIPTAVGDECVQRLAGSGAEARDRAQQVVRVLVLIGAEVLDVGGVDQRSTARARPGAETVNLLVIFLGVRPRPVACERPWGLRRS